MTSGFGGVMNERGPSPIEESGHATSAQSPSTWGVSILRMRMKGAFACVASRSSDAAPLWAINNHQIDAILCSFLKSTAAKKKMFVQKPLFCSTTILVR